MNRTDKEEMQYIEDFVHNLFSRAEDVNLLNIRNIKYIYLLHSQKSRLNVFERGIFPDIIRKVRYKIAIEKESGAPKDGIINSPGELPEIAKEMQPETRTGSRKKMEDRIEEKEKQHMEDFVRDLFSRTEDFNLLTKRIVMEMYMLHSQKDKLNALQRHIFRGIIMKVFNEFPIEEESVKANKKQTINPPAAQDEKSRATIDGNSSGESSEMQPETRTGSRKKMEDRIEEKEKQHMEDFVRDLFSRTEDFNLLTKRIVMEMYMLHSQKDKLNALQRHIFRGIIMKVFNEFPIEEESVKANKKQTINPPAAQDEKSRATIDGNSSGESSESGQEMEPESQLSRASSCQKVEDNISPDAGVTVAIELKGEGDVERKPDLSKNVKSTIQDFKGMKWSLPLLHPTKQIMSKEILLNNPQDKVKKISLCRGNKPSHPASATKISKPSLANSLQRLKTDKEFNEELPVKTTPLAHQSIVKKQSKTVTKGLATLEVMQPMLEDHNDGSVLSKSYLTDDDRGPDPNSSPACEKLLDKEDSLIPLEETSDSTPTRCCLATKRLVESNSKGIGDLTLPVKIKRIISSDSCSKNSSIRMELFRNHTVDYPPHIVSATEQRMLVIKSNSETRSPIKLIELPNQLIGDSSSTPLVMKEYSQQKNISLIYVNCTKADESKERKIMKLFRISISKKVIWENMDSESETESPPVIKEEKTKIKCKKKISRYKLESKYIAFNLIRKQFMLLTRRAAEECKTDTVKACTSKSPCYTTRDHQSF